MVVLRDIGRGRGIISWLAQVHYFGQRCPPIDQQCQATLMPYSRQYVEAVVLRDIWPGEGIRSNG